jgi:signal transduction histidine kinase
MRGYLREAFAPANDGAASSRNAGSAFDFRSRPEIPTQSDGMDHLLRALDHERQRLGQELHDSAGQLIACLQLSIARLEIEDPEHACLIHEIQDITSEIGREIRSFAFLHYPVDLADRGLASAVETLVRGFASRTGIKTAFTVRGDVAGLSDAGALALLRVAQEASVNVYRHAHASSAAVSLSRRGQSVELTVRDDGVGLAQVPEKSFGIGLQSMQHRVETLGGIFRITSMKRGVKVFASVPISA